MQGVCHCLLFSPATNLPVLECTSVTGWNSQEKSKSWSCFGGGEETESNGTGDMLACAANDSPVRLIRPDLASGVGYFEIVAPVPYAIAPSCFGK